MLCWQEFRKCLAPMGASGALSPILGAGAPGTPFHWEWAAPVSKAWDRPPRLPRDLGHPGSSPHTPQPGSRPKALRGRPGGPRLPWGAGEIPTVLAPSLRGAGSLSPPQLAAYLAGGLGRGGPALSGLGGGRGQGVSRPFVCWCVCMCVCAIVRPAGVWVRARVLGP